MQTIERDEIVEQAVHDFIMKWRSNAGATPQESDAFWDILMERIMKCLQKEEAKWASDEPE